MGSLIVPHLHLVIDLLKRSVCTALCDVGACEFVGTMASLLIPLQWCTSLFVFIGTVALKRSNNSATIITVDMVTFEGGWQCSIR